MGNRCLAFVGLLLLVVGCSPAVEGPGDVSTDAGSVPKGFQLTKTTNLVTGSLSTEDGVLTFRSELTALLRAELNMTINGKPFQWVNDDSLKMQTSTGFGVTLDYADRALLEQLSKEFSNYFVDAEPAPHEMFPAIAANYWVESPGWYRFDKRTISTAIEGGVKGLGDEASGIVCVQKGTTWTLPYTDENFNVHCATAVVGDDWGTGGCPSGNWDCMGRCGGGCGGFGGGWTMDCLEHDICGNLMCASGGGSDPDCGDEYDDAYDDFTAHMWGGGRCKTGDFSDVVPHTDTACAAPPAPVCGNLVLEGDEECDGNACCSSTCEIVADGTACTDGGSCQAGICEPPGAVCGNDVVEAGEACDGGPCCAANCQFVANGTTCPGDGTCQVGICEPPAGPVCGNGIIESGETCDGGDCCDATCEYVADGTMCTDGGSCQAGTCEAAPEPPPSGDNTVLDETNLSATTGQELYFEYVVPQGGNIVDIVMSGGTGDADLYVRKDAPVSQYNYDCAPYNSGNWETCTGTGPGTYYILVHAYSVFSGVSLQGSYY